MCVIIEKGSRGEVTEGSVETYRRSWGCYGGKTHSGQQVQLTLHIVLVYHLTISSGVKEKPSNTVEKEWVESKAILSALE